MRWTSVCLLFALLCTAVVRADDAPPGKPLEFEVIVVHVRSSEPLSAEQRTLNGAGILAAIPAWRNSGQIERMTSMRMSALENMKASVQIGETAAVVVGRTIVAGRGGGAGGGGAPGGGGFNPVQQQQVQFEQYGTTVECTGRITSPDSITFQVSAEQSRGGRAGAGTTKAAEGVATAEPEPIHPGRSITQSKTTMTSKSGECQIIGAAWNDGRDGTTGTLVLVVPRILPSK